MKSIIGVLCICGICMLPVQALKCPNGEKIYAWRITKTDSGVIARQHNIFRKMLLFGGVPGQPAAANMTMLRYDQDLSVLARKVSRTCKMDHVLAKDDRFKSIGQNIFMSWSSKLSPQPNWRTAINTWYQEYKYYKYPENPTRRTGHYTQLVWHTTKFIGCDYICFHDSSRPETPYAKLYTCNYGPGGNVRNQAPYPRAHRV